MTDIRISQCKSPKRKNDGVKAYVLKIKDDVVKTDFLKCKDD